MATQLRVCDAPGSRCARRCLAVPSNLPGQGLQQMAGRVAVALEEGDVDRASEVVKLLDGAVYDRGNKIALDWQLTADTLFAQVQLAQGETQAAYELAQAVAKRTLEQPRVFPEQLLDGLFAWALAAYDLGKAEEFVRLAEMFGDFPTLDCDCHREIRRIVLRCLQLLLLRRNALCIDIAKELEQYGAVSHFWLQVGRLIRTEAAERMSQEGDAIDFLAQADGLISHGLVTGAAILWLRRLPGARRIATRHFPHWPTVPQPLLDSARSAPPRRPDANLRIEAFGGGRVWSYGQEVNFTGPENPEDGLRRDPGRWGRPALALLTYLAMHPGGETLDRVMMDLWPNSRTPRSSFDKARASARAALGFDHIAVSGKQVYVADDTWVDAAVFERAYASARALPLENSLGRLETALALYTGTFLRDIDLLWVDDQRRHLQETAAWICWRMAAIYANDGQPGESIKLLRKALAIDALFERGLIDLVRQLDQVGQRAAAHRELDSYIERYAYIFRGAKPSGEVARLKQRLMDGDPGLTAAFRREDLLVTPHRPRLPRSGPTADLLADLDGEAALYGAVHMEAIAAQDLGAVSDEHRRRARRANGDMLPGEVEDGWLRDQQLRDVDEEPDAGDFFQSYGGSDTPDEPEDTEH